MENKLSVLDTLLRDLPAGWHITGIDVGVNWALSQVRHTDGTQRAGVANAPQQFTSGMAYGVGNHQPNMDANTILPLLRSRDESATAVALATLNALQQPDEPALTTFDAADWLSEQSKDRSIAIFGRFPFIEDEIRPFAEQVFVFEQSPQPGEFDASHMAQIIPQADILAITGSTILNQTIDDILTHTSPQQTIVLLGPSTPLTERLFECGVDALFGVRVADVEAAQQSVRHGVNFQKMHGLQRVSLIR